MLVEMKITLESFDLISFLHFHRFSFHSLHLRRTRHLGQTAPPPGRNQSTSFNLPTTAANIHNFTSWAFDSLHFRRTLTFAQLKNVNKIELDREYILLLSDMYNSFAITHSFCVVFVTMKVMILVPKESSGHEFMSTPHPSMHRAKINLFFVIGPIVY